MTVIPCGGCGNDLAELIPGTDFWLQRHKGRKSLSAGLISIECEECNVVSIVRPKAKTVATEAIEVRTDRPAPVLPAKVAAMIETPGARPTSITAHRAARTGAKAA